MNTQYFDARDAKRFVQLLDLARNDGNPHTVQLHDDGSVWGLAFVCTTCTMMGASLRMTN